MEENRLYQLLMDLNVKLCQERGAQMPQVDSIEGLWTVFRALVNTRPAMPVDPEWEDNQDLLLQGMIAGAGVNFLEDALVSPVDSRLMLWWGDITTLGVNAIVNAANDQLIGCTTPGHNCIDNNIHTFAGVQLRLECARIIQEQGHREPVGHAKITPGYNLPCDYIIHTVGPYVEGELTSVYRKQLASCYTSCLDVAAQHDVRSIAFCCIGTGADGFVRDEAAAVAVNAVRKWLDEHSSNMQVVFNVYTEEDDRAYRKQLGLWA